MRTSAICSWDWGGMAFFDDAPARRVCIECRTPSFTDPAAAAAR
jgi:hypothetical protein